jgi:hypothetical protein
MMPAAYVKPYVRRQKNDAADAAGICEAVRQLHVLDQEIARSDRTIPRWLFDQLVEKEDHPGRRS